MKKIIVFFMIFIFIFSSLSAFALDINTSINTAVNYYENNFKTIQNWDEIIALKTSSKNKAFEYKPMTTSECNLSDINSLIGFIISNVACKNTSKKDFGGMDMAKKLADFQTNKGVFGDSLYNHFYSMIALDMYGQSYDREAAYSYAVSSQLEDGSFSFDGKNGDIDLTALAIIAMSDRVMKKTEIMNCVNKAITYLNSKQLENGGFESMGNDNANSLAMVISALSSVGVDLKDERWHNILDSTERFKNPDGSYRYLENDEKKYNKFATSQMLMALNDAKIQKSSFKTVGIYTIYSPMKNITAQIIVLVVIFAVTFITGYFIRKKRKLK